MIKHLLPLLLLTLFLTSNLRATDPAQATGPNIAIGENSTVRVTQQGPFSITLDASQLPKDAVAKGITPKIRDLQTGPNQQTKVTFENPTQVFVGETEGIWQFKVTVTGLDPNSSQTRKAVVTLDKDYAKDYTLTNLPAGTVNWSVPPVPTPWNVNWDNPAADNVLGITVTTQDLPATNFRIVAASFKDSSGGISFGCERLQLAEAPNSTSNDERFPLRARSTQTFYVRLKDNSTRPKGKLTGSISFAVDERPELQTLQTTLNATSDSSKVFGAVLLAIGLVVSWWMTTRARPAVARLLAEKPVIALREALSLFRKNLEAVPPVPDITYLHIANRIKKLERQISTKQLDDESLLPSRFLLSFGAAADSSTKLQARLTDVSTQLLCMSTVLDNGILKIASEWNDAPDWKQANAAVALPKLDSLGSTAMTEAEAQAGMTPILSAYELPPHVDADFAPRWHQIDPVTVNEINYRIEHYSNTGWWIWGFVSVIVGCAILVVPNPGFGTSMDLILCLLWGLGIPTASAKLQELTPSGVSGNIGIAFPKAGS